MGKTLKYGEFEFPKSDVTYVRGYARGGKVEKVMHEFKEGTLHSGSKKGPVVQNRKQAVAIAMSEAGKSKKMACGGMAKRFADGGPVNKPIPNPVNLPPKPNIPKPGDQAPKKLLGEQMGWPKKNEIGKQSYAKGGEVKTSKMAKPAPTMKPRSMGSKGKEGMVSGKGKGMEPMGALSAMSGGMGGMPMMKVGGSVGKMNRLKPTASTSTPPKSINVKSRMSAGVGSIENMKHGGVVKKFAMGGMAHADEKADKALIKRAVGMHDTQLHEGKHTNLTKLSHGGKVRWK